MIFSTRRLFRSRPTHRAAHSAWIESLEQRWLLANNSVIQIAAPAPITLASDDAQSYAAWTAGSNGGSGLGPATIVQGSGGNLFLATGTDSLTGGKSFGITAGASGPAVVRSILAPASSAEYTFSASFNEDNTNGFDGFSIKSAPGSNFADGELLRFGLS